MDHKKVIEATAKYIFSEFQSEGSGHDWFHIERVRKMALLIGSKEHANPFLVELAALLHDLDDWKLNSGVGDDLPKTKNWLANLEIEPEIITKILEIICEVSFKGAKIETPVNSVEAAIVQDADRLDAMGAIGIARAFAYGGHTNRLIYDPAVSIDFHSDFLAYKKSTAPTINHFYEKLLLLKDRMNTKTAKIIAEERHGFMVEYLNQFFNEWEAKK
jgi:uncharacterized protein